MSKHKYFYLLHYLDNTMNDNTSLHYYHIMQDLNVGVILDNPQHM